MTITDSFDGSTAILFNKPLRAIILDESKVKSHGDDKTSSNRLKQIEAQLAEIERAETAIRNKRMEMESFEVASLKKSISGTSNGGSAGPSSVVSGPSVPSNVKGSRDVEVAKLRREELENEELVNKNRAMEERDAERQLQDKLLAKKSVDTRKIEIEREYERERQLKLQQQQAASTNRVNNALNVGDGDNFDIATLLWHQLCEVLKNLISQIEKSLLNDSSDKECSSSTCYTVASSLRRNRESIPHERITKAALTGRFTQLDMFEVPVLCCTLLHLVSKRCTSFIPEENMTNSKKAITIEVVNKNILKTGEADTARFFNTLITHVKTMCLAGNADLKELSAIFADVLMPMPLKTQTKMIERVEAFIQSTVDPTIQSSILLSGDSSMSTSTIVGATPDMSFASSLSEGKGENILKQAAKKLGTVDTSVSSSSSEDPSVIAASQNKKGAMKTAFASFDDTTNTSLDVSGGGPSASTRTTTTTANTKTVVDVSSKPSASSLLPASTLPVTGAVASSLGSTSSPASSASIVRSESKPTSGGGGAKASKSSMGLKVLRGGDLDLLEHDDEDNSPVRNITVSTNVAPTTLGARKSSMKTMEKERDEFDF